MLRPGGSLSVAVWDSLNKNILTYASATALRNHLPPALRSLLDDLERFAMPRRRERWLQNAGLSQVDSELFCWTAEFPDEQAMWDFTSGPGLFQHAIAALDDNQRAHVRTSFGELLADYRRSDGAYELPYACRLIWGRR